MKLTNRQITSLLAAGMSSLKYAALNNVEAMNAYRLRRDLVRLGRDFEDARNGLVSDMWEDKDLLAKAREYEVSQKGMTPEEYKAAIEANMPKIVPLLAELEKEEKDIAIKSISFEGWLQLLKDNPWLAGWEETLADFIVQPE